MSLQSNTNNDIFIIPSQSLIQFSGSEASPIALLVEPSGAVNFVGTTGSILKIMDNLSDSLFSVNNISGLSILEVFSNNQVKLGNPANYALVVSGSNVIITGSLVDKGTGVKFLVVDTATGVVHTTGSGGGGGSPTSPASPVNSIQYNNAGAFGAVATLTYDGTTLRATGSFTGSLTGSLFGTASWAQSASQAISASYINISSSNTATLEVSYATPGVIALLAKTGSGNTAAQGSVTQLQYNAGGSPAVFGGVASSSFDNGSGQLILGNLIATGSLLGTASFATSASRAVSASFSTSASLATTASYVNLVAGPRIQAINYSGSVISITGSIGGADTNIQFNSGSAFSGSGRFTFDYTTNTARLTGSLIVTGSSIVTGSFNVYNSGDTFFTPTIIHDRLTQVGATNPYMSLSLIDGLGVSGSVMELQSLSKGTTVNPYFQGGINIGAYPHSSIAAPTTPQSGRPIKFLNSILGTANTSSFEWHYNTILRITGSTLIAKLDAPSGNFMTSGSINIASDSTYSTAVTHDALYFGTPGAAGSWRIALSGSALVVDKWFGLSYSRSATFT
jgi:hypothetical protein